MGKIHAEIGPELRAFIEEQHVFFIATSPLEESGHVNCSPKGLDSLRILGPRALAYLDYVGSGVETIAHVRENGRVVLMLCAFEGPPRIVRFHGRGSVLEPGDDGFRKLLSLFDPKPGARAVIRIDLARICDSCGYGVPLMRFEGDRTQLPAYSEAKGPDRIAAYKREMNALSIDGLPGLQRLPDTD